MPRFRGLLGRAAEGAVRAARRHRRLGQPVFDDELRRRGADRPRDRQVSRQWRALQGRQAGPVVDRRANRARRGRGRIPRPELEHAVIRPKIVVTAGPRVPGQKVGGLAHVGELLLVAEPLVEQFTETASIGGYEKIASFKGAALVGTVCRHPLHGQGYDFDVPLLAAGFVEADQGTGLVHIAPGHGTDDWELGQANGLAVPETVGPDGVYLPSVPLFAGRAVYRLDGKPGDADSAVIAAVEAAGGLLARGTLVHSYPHSWRSKAPLIFRNTPQWFISM